MKPLTLISALFLTTACVPEREADPEGAAGAPADPEAPDDPAPAGGGDVADEPGDGAGGPADPPDGEASDEPAGGPADDAPLALDDGAACVADVECGSGRCAVPCEGYGTCVPAGCQADADCGIDAVTGGTHCCVGGACAAVPGGACGDRSAGQGGSCAAGGVTACGDGLACLSACAAGAFCAAACDTDEACAELGDDLGCYRSIAGDRRCVPDPQKGLLCTTDADCDAEGTACSVGVSWDGTSVIKRCLPFRGDRRAGRRCSEHMECRSGLCFEGVCSGACTQDADCTCEEDDRRCRRDQPCLEVMLFVAPERGGRVRLCYPADRCESTDDCDGDVCRAWPEEAGWTTVCEDPPDDAEEEGDPCAGHEECESGLCFEGSCADVCTEDAHCPRGLECLREVVDADPPVADRSIRICI